MAGEIFFQNLQQLLGKPDSVDLADLLEVHYLCLLLGYRGRYSVGGTGELQATMQATADKIRRIRGPVGALSPSWELKAEQVAAPKDRATKTFMIIAAACLVLALVLFIGYKFSLSSGAGQIAASAGRVRS